MLSSSYIKPSGDWQSFSPSLSGSSLFTSRLPEGQDGFIVLTQLILLPDPSLASNFTAEL